MNDRGIVPPLRRAASRQSYAAVPVLVAIVLFVVNIALQPSFVSHGNWATELSEMCPLVLTSMAAAIPMLSGNGSIDLSIGPFMGFMVVFIAAVLVPAGISAPELLLPLVLAFGLAAGSVNGILVAYLRVPAIIATLGTYLFYTGISAKVLPTPGGTVPSWVVHLNGFYGPIPGVLFVFAGAGIVWTLIARTSFRRNLLAAGGEQRAAYTAGVNVARTRLWAFAFSGALTALAGLMFAGLLQNGDATVGPPYTISAITGVALGGINLAGGRGGLFGAAIGGIILYLIQSVLTAANVSVYELNIANGALLILALAVNGALAGLHGRGARSLLTQLQALGGRAPQEPA
jgi:ribose transport system permease protein